MECKTPWRPSGKRHVNCLTAPAGYKTATASVQDRPRHPKRSVTRHLGPRATKSAQPEPRPKHEKLWPNMFVERCISHRSLPTHFVSSSPSPKAKITSCYVSEPIENFLALRIKIQNTETLPEPITQHPVISRYAGVPAWIWWWGESPRRPPTAPRVRSMRALCCPAPLIATNLARNTNLGRTPS